jgi:hypothetical protein
MKRSRMKRGSGSARKQRMLKIPTVQIGDGKTPNKYWVSVSSDYYIEDKKNRTLDWASDSKFSPAVQGKTLKTFSTYEEAKAYADSIPLESKVQGVEANTVSVEDRLTGQVYERSVGTQPHEDIMFTKDKEKELGVSSSLRKSEGRVREINQGNLVDYIMDYEGGSISKENYLRLFSYLIRTGQAWSLQGSIYGRPAHDLIESGVISKGGKINWDKVDGE